MNFRAMAADQAIAQFESLFRYAPRAQRLRLQCVDNIMPKSYLAEVFPFIATPPNVGIFYEVKADLTEEDMRSLDRARVRWIQPGIEALATSTLKLMRKGTSSYQNIRLLQLCTLYDVWPYWNLLVGFPNEGEEVYEKYLADIPRLVHLPPPSGAHPVRFDRFSPYFVRPAEYGLDLHPLDYYGLIYPLDPESLMQLAYYFGDANQHRADYFLALARKLGPLRDQVAAWRNRWEGNDAGTAPSLVMRRSLEGTTIYDSRSGEVEEYQIDELTQAVLEALATPKRAAALEAAIPQPHPAGLDRTIAWLRARGLLFEEGDRLMSLVLPSMAPQGATSFVSQEAALVQT
jgi:magnesium-protoporphyrin IX monomethyl ester (oxidative) cyclase